MKYRQSAAGFLGFPPAISNIVLFTAVIYLLQGFIPANVLFGGLALVPAQVATKGMVWELVTYMFLHGGMMHLFFNMFGLVMFGRDLESWWGSRDFTKYYFITGVGAGVTHVITAYIFGGTLIPTIGASGAIFGILVAYAMAFPERKVLLWFVIPVSARTMVLLFGFLQLAMLGQVGDNVARFAHLGGMLTGFLYLKQESLVWGIKRFVGRLQQSGVDRHQEPRPRGSDPESQAQIDAILEKISREGMGALSEEERKILQEAGARARRRQHGTDD